MSLTDTQNAKIADAIDSIKRVIPHYKDPVIMSSFGKDSMVMLHLLKRVGLRYPIIFHREPFFPKKLEFANRIIEKEGYTTYDWPPSATTFLANNGHTGFVKWYSIGQKFMMVALDCVKPVMGRIGEDVLCGLDDIYHKPVINNFAFPWDLVFVGHKSTDTDRIYGEVPLKVDLKKNEGGPDYFYPLRHFTDADIWAYHLHYDLPINERRYDRANNFKEFEDVTFNNDKYPVCVRCMDKNESATVFCPKLAQNITNISSEINYSEPVAPEYARKE